MAKLIKQIIDDLLTPMLQDFWQVPIWIRWSLVVVTCAATIPLAVIYRARHAVNHKPRIHIIQNMDNQPKSVAQDGSDWFLDGRIMRPKIDGTVARGDMAGDTHFFMGIENDEWATEFPSQVTIDKAFIERGQDRFNIYCTPCHGAVGYGDGLIHVRAMTLVETGANGTSWVAPKNLHEALIKEQPVGQLFNTITNGVRTMAAYASQIPTKDRWAIVAYIKALQFSQDADPELVEGSESFPQKEKQGGDE
ncbi:MAG: cytochrome c [Phycisphaerales bacterium]|nr:cytochrome c [Phycisphaerales bacterium]